MRDNTGANLRCLNLAQFEGEGGSDVSLFSLGLTYVELARLAVMVGKGLRPDTKFKSPFLYGIRMKALLGCFTWATFPPAPRVRLIVDPSIGIHNSHVPILLEMREGTLRRIN